MRDITYIEEIVGSRSNTEITNTTYSAEINTKEADYISSQILFQNCVFREDFRLYGNVFTEDVVFNDCIFNYLNFTVLNFIKRLEFRNCSFKGKFEIEASQFNETVYFINNCFEKEVNFFMKEDCESYGFNEFYQGVIFRQEWEKE